MGSGCANNQVTAVGDRLPSGKSVESRFKARGQRICRAIGSEKWSEIVSLCKLEGGTDIKRRSRSQFHFLAWSLFLFLRFFSSPTYLVRLIFETSGIFCSRDLLSSDFSMRWISVTEVEGRIFLADLQERVELEDIPGRQSG